MADPITIPQPIISPAMDQRVPPPPGFVPMDSSDAPPPPPPGFVPVSERTTSPVDDAIASVPRPQAPKTTALIPDSHPELHPEAAVDPITRIKQQAQDALTKHAVIREGLLGAAAGTGAAETPNSLKDTATGAAKMFALGPNADETDPVSKTLSYVPVLGPLYRMINGTLQSVNQAGGDVGEGLYRGAHGDPDGYPLAAHGGGQLLTSMIGAALGGREAPGALAEIDKKLTPPAVNDVVKNTYSEPGDHISAALRSNARVDVPAEAKIAHQAIREGLEDRGYSTKDFQNRNGAAALKNGIDNAIDIQESRAKGYIDPIRGDVVDPKVLAENPELAARFPDKIKVTYGDLDAERIKMNKELRRANYYAKDPSAQYAAADPLADTEDAVKQARDLVYGRAEDVTGQDLRPIKQTESALIKLGDLANSTSNILSSQQAELATQSKFGKAVQAGRDLVQGARKPSTLLGITEKGANPLKSFNRHMQAAFPDLTPNKAPRGVGYGPGKVGLPNYNLNMTPPEGSLPGPIQQILNLSGGENIPGHDLNLTPPEGQMPPDFQRPMPFEGGENIAAKPIPDILGQGLISKEPLNLKSPGDMPPDAQRPLPLTEPPAAEPRQVFPGQINGPSGPVTPPETGNAPKGGGTPPKGNEEAFSVEQIKNFAVDRAATEISGAEKKANKLPSGMSQVQRAQQLKEQLQAAPLETILQAAKSYNLK